MTVLLLLFVAPILTALLPVVCCLALSGELNDMEGPF